MGDQQQLPVEGQLAFVGTKELERLIGLDVDRFARGRIVATAARVNALYMIARAGSGHIGSSFSSLEIVTWLHLERLDEDGVYFSSKGHDAPGLYAVLIATGVLPESKLHELRRLGGLPGHPDVSTPGIVVNTGSLGMGISKAKGMVHAARRAGRPIHVYVLTGDGELQEGQIWESLASAANLGMDEITVIVDHNKLQSDTYVARVSDLGDLEAKWRAFGWAVARCDGHDVGALDAALTPVPGQPLVVIADTIKGRGVSFMEHTTLGDERLYRYHSGAPSGEDYRAALAELVAALDDELQIVGADGIELELVQVASAPASGETVERLVDAYGAALVGWAAEDERVVALDADLARDTGLLELEARFPDRFIECGIAEQDMVSTASGLAAAGLQPVVHSFACFLSTRPNEQIYNTATERRRVLYVGSLAGLLPGGPGHSHQSVRDLSALGGVPGLVAVQPATEAQVARSLDVFRAGTESMYLRLSSVPVAMPVAVPDEPLVVGRGQVVLDGDGDVVMITYGPVLLREAALAVASLGPRASAVRLVNMPFLNRIDPEWLAMTIRGARHVLTVDDHYPHGGVGALVASALAATGDGPPLVALAVDDIPACGTADEVLQAHGLDRVNLARRLGKLLDGTG